jgi:hypothetical protein
MKTHPRTLQTSFVILATALSALASPVPYSPPTSGLVSWWRGDGNALDSADGNHGVALNGAGYTPGVSGSAFWFDGFNDHIRVADSTNLRITSALTVSAWVYRVDGGYQGEILSKWDAVPTGQRAYTLTIEPDGRAGFGLSTVGLNTDVAAYTSAALPLNAWAHIAGTYDGSSIKIYLNGDLKSQVAYSGGIFSGTDDLSLGGVAGGVSAGDGVSFFHGGIDEAMVYNRALSAGEVMTLATVPEPASTVLLLLGVVGFFSYRRRCANVPKD